jgi:RES domain-containing protein
LSHLQHFLTAFRMIPGTPLQGSFFRAIQLHYANAPLSTIGSIINGGRYNPKDTFEAYYVAPSPDTTLYEIRALTPNTQPTPIAPTVMFTVNITLQHTVNLNDNAVLATLGIAPTDLHVEWDQILRQHLIPITHEIGYAARLANVEALIVPSTRHTGATNLVIFNDRLRSGSSIVIKPATGFEPSTEIELLGTYIPDRP